MKTLWIVSELMWCANKRCTVVLDFELRKEYHVVFKEARKVKAESCLDIVTIFDVNMKDASSFIVGPS